MRGDDAAMARVSRVFLTKSSVAESFSDYAWSALMAAIVLLFFVSFRSYSIHLHANIH